MKKWAIAAGVAVLFLASAPRVAAQADDTVTREQVGAWTLSMEDRDYEALPATPTYGGDTGLFHLPSAYTVPRGRVSVSGFRNNLDRDPKDEDISVHGATLAFGVTSRLELFGSVGLQNRINADALGQPGFVNDYPFVTTSWQTGFGDVWLGLKVNLLNDQRGDAAGLAIRGFVKIPTADEAKGLGTGKVSGGADLILSKGLGRVADIHAAIGFQANSDPDGVSLGNAVKYGVGLNFPTGRRFQIQAELTGASYNGASFEQTKPADLVLGPVVFLGRGFFIRPAISWNLNFDGRGVSAGVPSYTGRQISIGYHPGTVGRAVYTAVQAPPQPAPSNRPPTVSCRWENAVVRIGEPARIRAQGSDPDGDALTYTWSTERGRVTGRDSEATFDTTGVTGPGPLVVAVQVSDGRGASAQATCEARIEAARAVESVTCTSSGFPRNLDRLNNVDKACLDDVATRLRQDPRGRVAITGHAAPGERYPEVLSRKRAEAARAYLVRDRGVEESRITARGAGASAAGRTVEVEFISGSAAERR